MHKLLEGLRRKRPQKPDVRIPITLEMLKKLICALHSVCFSNYEKCLFASAFSLAFFAMLRVSELTVPNKSKQKDHALNIEDLLFKQSPSNQEELHVILRSSKTDQKSNSVTLILGAQSDRNICPISLLKSYLKVRFSGTDSSNKLYVHFEGSSLTRYQFCSVLQKCLGFCEIPFHVRSHSFRIGRATDMAKNGISEEQIKLCGRWKSQSYLRYIRL